MWLNSVLVVTSILLIWKCNSLCFCEVLCYNKPDGQRLGDEMYVWADGSPTADKMDWRLIFASRWDGLFVFQVEFGFARKFCHAVISKDFPCWGFWHGGGWWSGLSPLSISSPGLSSFLSRNRDWGAAVSSGLQVNTYFWFLWLSFQHLFSRISVCVCVRWVTAVEV